MTQYIVWAWYPTGWQLHTITASWDEALAAYREAKGDTTGPVYLCEVKTPGDD
jgi:hypothetical protein